MHVKQGLNSLGSKLHLSLHFFAHDCVLIDHTASRLHRGTLSPIWPLSSNYKNIRPVTPSSQQLFHP